MPDNIHDGGHESTVPVKFHMAPLKPVVWEIAAVNRAMSATVDNDLFGALSEHEWSATESGCFYRTTVAGTVVWLHREIARPGPNQFVRWLNGKRQDLRRANLQVVATRAEVDAPVVRPVRKRRFYSKAQRARAKWWRELTMEERLAWRNKARARMLEANARRRTLATAQPVLMVNGNGR